MQNNFVLGQIHSKNYELLRILNQICLPVHYSDSFYQFICSNNEFSFYLGAITARKEVRNEQNTLYIMTLTILPAYRRLKIGSFLVQKILEQAKAKGMDGVYLHVWVSNTIAQDFYNKLGFQIKEQCPGYYKDITPNDGVLLGKSVSEVNI